MRRPVLALCCTGSLLLSIPLGRASEPNLQPAIEKLGSSSTADRITGLREVGRLKPSAATARPVLEKVVNDPAPEMRGEVVWVIADLLGPSGLDLLQKLHKDHERTVRDGAIRAICRMWDARPAREACSSAYYSTQAEYGARIEVIDTLREYFPRDPAAVDIFRAGLKDPSEMVQRAAVFGVQSARDPKSVPDLARLAKNGSDVVAEPAAGEALATIATPEAVQALIELLPKPKGEPGKPVRPSERVRATAARALERIKDPKSLPALRAQLSDPSPTVRVAVIGALTAMKDKSAVPEILPQLKDKESRVRQMSLRALRQIGEPAAADAVRQVLREDRDPNVRMTAVSTLADLLGPKSIKDLEGVREDLAPEVRLEAAADLAAFGKPAAPSLALFLKDPSPDVRKMAIQGLGQVGGPEHIPAISAAAIESGRVGVQVKMSVAEALGSIGHTDGVPTLAKFAADADPNVRQSAAAALGAIGGPAAQKVLDSLLRDPVSAVRNAARRASDVAAKKKG